MGSGKRQKKTARKQSAEIPTWLSDKNVPILFKREVEDALARHAADNGLRVGSKKFNALTLQDICASLKLVHDRWSAVEPGMINAATQPVTKALAAHLQACKKKRATMEQMVADLEAAADDGAQSSQGSDEEGESSDSEESQADGSDGEPADPKPAHGEGNPHELVEKAEDGAAADGQRAEGAEGTAADGQRSVPLVDQVLS